MPLTTYTAGEVLTAASLNDNFTFAAANPPCGSSLLAQQTVRLVAATLAYTANWSSVSYADFATSKILVIALQRLLQQFVSVLYYGLTRNTAIAVGDTAQYFSFNVRVSAAATICNSTITFLVSKTTCVTTELQFSDKHF
jgi:hypothetical protein